MEYDEVTILYKRFKKKDVIPFMQKRFQECNPEAEPEEVDAFGKYLDDSITSDSKGRITQAIDINEEINSFIELNPPISI